MSHDFSVWALGHLDITVTCVRFWYQVCHYSWAISLHCCMAQPSSQPTLSSGFGKNDNILFFSLVHSVVSEHMNYNQYALTVAALLRAVRVTAGLVERNGSLPPGLWLTSPAGWLPRTGISSGTLRSAIKYGLPFIHLWRWLVVGDSCTVAYASNINSLQWLSFKVGEITTLHQCQLRQVHTASLSTKHISISL